MTGTLGVNRTDSNAADDGKAIIQVNAVYPAFRIYGGLKHDSPPIKLDRLLKKFIPGIPDTDDALEITTLNFSADTTNKNYAFEGEIQNLWTIALGDTVELTVASLYLMLQRSGRSFGVTINGELELLNKTFVLFAERPLGLQFWRFSAALDAGDRLSLPEIVNQVAGSSVNLVESDLTQNLINLEVKELGFAVETSPSKRFKFRGAFDWTIELGGGTQLIVDARLAIESFLPVALAGGGQAGGQPSGGGQPRPARRYIGEISGAVSFNTIDSDLFQNLSVRAAYRFSPDEKVLTFQLTINDLEFIAQFRKKTLDRLPPEQTLVISFGNTTFGAILTFMVQLVDPTIGDFQLDPPWNELNSLSLRGLELEINLTRKQVTFRFAANANLGFINIQFIGLKYLRVAPPPPAPPGASGKKTVEIELIGSFLGKSHGPNNPLGWDTLNEAPPAVPGQGSGIFDLQYLGLGQHVSFDQATLSRLTNITQIMDTLQERVRPLRGNPAAIPPVAPTNLLQFNAQSGWLIGAQFSVIDTLEINLIFNDPVLYGIRIGLRGAKAKIFAGLIFEILYRRISDTIGVYHIELVLPDAMRQLEFGAVSVTLPTIVVDIYTNGDFKLDFGFPWRFNFARSFAIDAFPFTGAGGFYFNKLSAETATSVPIITNGRFNPVIEFGIGLKIGLGKTFNKGVLKAEISITVQGLLEGVIAWFNPTDPALATDQYYRIQGGVAIVGRLWGMVDFSVIQVEVEVIVRVAVLFVVESYKPIFLTLTAEVSVRASIKIVFVTISLSFKLQITQEFTLGSARPTPWILDPDQSARRPVTGTGTDTGQGLPAAPSAAMAAMNTPESPEMALREEPAVGSRAIATPLSTPFSAPPATPIDGVPSVSEAGTEATPGFTTDQPSPEASSGASPKASPGATPIAFRSDATSSVASTIGATFAATPSGAAIATFGLETPVAATPLSWQPIAIFPAKVTLNLFFQPAFTRNSDEVQGIALLFIENSIDPNSPGYETYQADAATDTDFDLLAQALLTWAIYAYKVPPRANPTDTATPIAITTVGLTELETLYTMLTNRDDDEHDLFSYQALSGFLQANFILNISDCAANASGTIFPMIPQLAMQLGDRTAERFDAPDRQLNEGDRQDLIRYFAQLKASHGSTVEQTSTPIGNRAPGTNPVRDSAEGYSVATFIVVDYFQMLVRSVVQQAIDLLKDTTLTHLGLTDLLQRLNRGGQFNHLAAMSSRFLLHGLRIPDRRVAEGDRTQPNRPTRALYRELGQRFTFTAPVKDFTITLTNPDGLEWITFTDYNQATPPQKVPAASLRYVLSRNTEMAALIHQLRSEQTQTDIQSPDFLPITPTILNPYLDQPRRYSLNQKIAWLATTQANQPAHSYAILHLPDNLQAHLASDHHRRRNAQDSSPGLALRLRYGKPAVGKTDLRPSDLRSLTDYAFATRITLNLRRVPTPDGTALLPTTYRLSGTSNADKNRLEDLWQYLHTTATTPQLFLLYGAVDRSAQSNGTQAEFQTGLTNQIATHSLLLKTNLSTHNPAPIQASNQRNSLYSATLSEATGTDFIQLLWEGCAVNTGGYHLHYNVQLSGQTSGQTNDAPQGLPEHLFTDGLSAAVELLVLLKPDAEDSVPLPAHHFQNCVVVREALPDLEDSVLLVESDDTAKTLSIPAGNIGFRLERPTPHPVADQTGADELQQLYHLLGFRLLETDAFWSSHEGLPLGPAEDDPTTPQDDDRWIYERVIPIYSLAKQFRLSDKPALPPATLDPYAGISPTAAVAIAFQWRDLYGTQIKNAETFPPTPVRYFDPLLGINQWSAVVESYAFRPVSAPNPSANGNTAPSVELLIELVLDQTKYLATAGRTLPEVRQVVSTARATYQQIYYQIHQPDLGFQVHTSVIPRWEYPSTPAEQHAFKQPLVDFVETTYRYLSTLEMVEAPTHTAIATDTLQHLSEVYHVSLQSLSIANADVVGVFSSGATITIGDRAITTQPGNTLRSLATLLQTTLTALAIAANAIALNPVVLTIPDRITLPAGLPAAVDGIPATTLTAVTGTLKAKIAQDLSVPTRPVAPTDLRFSSTEISAATELQQAVQRMGDCTAVAIANQNRIGLLVAGAELLPDTLTAPVLTQILGVLVAAEAASTAAEIAQILNQVTSTSLTAQDWQALLENPEQRRQINTIRPNDTFASIANRFTEVMGKPVAIANIVLLLHNRPGFLVAGQSWLAPPIVVRHSINLTQTAAAQGATLAYPVDPIFPVTVQIDTHRDPQRVDPISRQAVPEIQRITAFLSPKTTQLSAAVVGTTEDIASLRGFAQEFEAAFPGLHLAVGDELPHKHSTHPTLQDNPEVQINRPLWAVHFGTSGIDYNINESYPFFFSPAPLANSLLSGTVPIQRYESGTGLGAAERNVVEAVDLNILARDFLVAVEDFLDPAIAISAAQLRPAQVSQILRDKETLADAIHHQVTHVLAQTDQTDIGDRRTIAADTLRQKLLINLVEGFDIETIIQYQVTVDVNGIAANDPQWTLTRSPRLSGQPVVLNLRHSQTGELLPTSEFNITVSGAKVPMSPGGSYLTFFCDTTSPEKFENVQLELLYRVNEMEYDITDVPGIQQYQASSWLNFILPIEGHTNFDNANYIGTVDIPIPLRSYPMTPSLVLHRAEADRDSWQTLQHIREWQYTFVYEHIDIAQDDIEATLYTNTSPLSSATDAASSSLSAEQRPLFEALVNFSLVYPAIQLDLQKLSDRNSSTHSSTHSSANSPANVAVVNTAIEKAIEAIASLIHTVATAWSGWRSAPIQRSTPATPTDYVIQEETPLGAPTTKRITLIRSDRQSPFPTVVLPGYEQSPNQSFLAADALSLNHTFLQKSLQDAANDPVFGESSIPDYVLSLPDLDVVQQQNAWAAVRLTRNKNLVFDRVSQTYRQTNPLFVFQTPESRFTNPVTPLLLNTRRWNLASLAAATSDLPTRPLEDYIQAMFDTLLPAQAEQPYDLRVACRYAFALARNNQGDDLLSTLPVLLGSRLSVPVGEGGRSPVILNLRDSLATGIRLWQRDTLPVETGAMFIFTVSLFSNLSTDSPGEAANLPLLRVDHLAVYLQDIDSTNRPA